MRLGVGYDIVDVAEVAASLRTHGARYVSRVFTQAEAGAAPDAHRLAAAFAGKEAVVKALGVDDRLPYDWRSVEIADEPQGPSVRLSGALALHAASRRVSGIAVSIAVRREHASAMAVVTFDGRGEEER